MKNYFSLRKKPLATVLIVYLKCGKKSKFIFFFVKCIQLLTTLSTYAILYQNQ